MTDDMTTATATFEFVDGSHLKGSLHFEDADGNLPAAAELARAAVAGAWPNIDAYAASELPWALSIRLGGESEGRDMNREFRHRDYATNVLSFPSDEQEPDASEWYVGDIFICLPVVLREAAEQGIPAGQHLQHLVVHGLLHLVGYDHELGEHEAAVMESLETEILTGMGLPDPYADTNTP